MPRFAANISLLFTEYPLTQRFARAVKAGFEGVELLFPYALEPQELADLLAQSGLRLALINSPAPDWEKGARGTAAILGATDRFRAEFETALRYGEKCKTDHIHILAGIAAGPAAHQAYLENLSWAAAQTDQSLTIEPINPQDMPGYFLNDFDQAIRILDQVNRPNLNLQFDAYHAYKITGDVQAAWAAYGARAVHVQIAAAEERHEPADGVIDYVRFFKRLDQNYTGWVSAEYFPKSQTEEGLNWLSTAAKKV